jgi:hypothetical protein
MQSCRDELAEEVDQKNADRDEAATALLIEAADSFQEAANYLRMELAVSKDLKDILRQGSAARFLTALAPSLKTIPSRTN